mgnify:FL=1
MYDVPHYMSGMHWIWWLVWVTVIVAAWWSFTRRAPASAADTPLARLQRRYADGEIQTAEYEERKAALLH